MPRLIQAHLRPADESAFFHSVADQEPVGDRREAVQSALNQTFRDFELVVSDNDDSNAATRDAIAKFKDPRIRLSTSGQLPMHENWENAFNLATGEHVLILRTNSVW
jgi:hypothetical protein